MTLCFVFFVLSNEYEGYFDFFNLPIYTDRISELIQAKILKKSFTLIGQNIMSSIKKCL